MDEFKEERRIELLQQIKEKYSLPVAILRKIQCGNKIVYMTLLMGGIDKEYPTAFMNNVVSEYVEDRMFNEYVDSHLDNPWFRIIIEDVNDLINEELV